MKTYLFKYKYISYDEEKETMIEAFNKREAITYFKMAHKHCKITEIKTLVKVDPAQQFVVIELPNESLQTLIVVNDAKFIRKGDLVCWNAHPRACWRVGLVEKGSNKGYIKVRKFVDSSFEDTLVDIPYSECLKIENDSKHRFYEKLKEIGIDL